MSGYNPETTEIDFDADIEGLFSSIKKGFKKVGGVVDKVTDATITKPSAFIGGLVGGKKGRALGQKLGGFTSKVTKLGVGAGAAGIASAAAPAVLPFAGAAALASRKSKKRRASHDRDDSPARKVRRAKHRRDKRERDEKRRRHSKSDAEAARVAALLAKKLGGPLSKANRYLKLAELQRQATHEHRKLMGDAEFRKKVLRLLTLAAEAGDQNCERTVRVILAR